MRQLSCVGGPINRQQIAVTTSCRLRALTNWRRCSGRRSRPADAPARRLRAYRFSGAFLILWRPRRIAFAITLLTRGKFQKAGEGSVMPIDVFMRIAKLAKARKQRGQGEIGRCNIVELFPVQ